MNVFDIQHQYRVVNAGRFIERYDVPCEGSRSRVTGQIIIVIKDYVNAPTVDSFSISFANTKYNLLPNNEVNYQAWFGGVALVILPAALAVVLPFMKETDLGIHVDDFITEPMGKLEVNLNFSAVPSAFNIYIRPIFEIRATQPLIQGGLRVEGVRKDIAYVRDSEDFSVERPADPGGMAQSRGVGETDGLENIPAKVKIEDVNE